MDLQQYLHAARTYWWAVAVPVVLGLAVGVVNLSRAEPQYRASLTYFVGTAGGDGASAAAVQGDEFAQRRVNSYVELLTTDRLAEAIVAASDLDLTPSQVKAMMGAHADVDTVLLTATVTGGSRAEVAGVADAVAGEFGDFVAGLETPGNGPPSVSLDLVSGPDVHRVPPRTSLTVGIPVVAGLAVGLAAAWLLELRDKTIRSEDELRALGLGPILGLIPVDRRLREARSAGAQESTPGTEAFRQLRTNLEFLDVDRPSKTVVVTSSSAGEGKTTTTVHLALALAAADRHVVVVEGDLRQPTVVDHFPGEGATGLTDVLVGHATIDDALQPTAIDRVTVLLSGQLPPNPSELLGTDAMVHVLATLRERFDIVLVNTPPLVPVTDAAVVAAHADGVLMVVRAGRTTRQQATQAVRSIHAVGARLLGTVLNMEAGRRGSAYVANGAGSAAVVRPHLPVPLDEGEHGEDEVGGHERRVGPAEPVPPEAEGEDEAQQAVVGGDDRERVQQRRSAWGH
jgi:capsular exopolysaccharide synthesis family protein